MVNIIAPLCVQGEPAIVQSLYVNEYERVNEQTHNHVCSLQAADSFLREYYLEHDEPRQEHVSLTMEGTLREMSAAEVIPQDILAKIKMKDKHPFFVQYLIGGQGISTGSIDGVIQRKIWSFGAIKELARKIVEGAATVINGHTKDNQPKRQIGKIVHSFTQKINNVLSAIAIAWITDPNTKAAIQSGELDTCSVEGDVVLNKTGRDSPWYIQGIDNITHLAIASSKTEKPGFPQAGILACIQELTEKGENEMPEKEISLIDVKTFIEANNIPPGELFKKSDLINSKEMLGHVEDEKTEALKEQKLLVRRLEKKTKELVSFKDNITTLDLVRESKSLADKDSRTIDYIQKRLQLNFDDDMTDKHRKQVVEEAIETELKMIDELGVTFAEVKEPQGDSQEVDTIGNIDSSDSGTDYSKSENNSLIPQQI